MRSNRTFYVKETCLYCGRHKRNEYTFGNWENGPPRVFVVCSKCEKERAEGTAEVMSSKIVRGTGKQKPVFRILPGINAAEISKVRRK